MQQMGRDVDAVGAVVSASAGTAYGLETIPARWREAVWGECSLKNEVRWSVVELVGLVDRLVDVFSR